VAKIKYQWRQTAGFEGDEDEIRYNLVRDGIDVLLFVTEHEKRDIDSLAADLKAGTVLTSEVQLFGFGKPVGDGDWDVEASIGGCISEVRFQFGDSVTQGEPVIIEETFLNLNQLVAPRTGTIIQIGVRAGQRVDAGDFLFRLKATE